LFKRLVDSMFLTMQWVSRWSSLWVQMHEGWRFDGAKLRDYILYSKRGARKAENKGFTEETLQRNCKLNDRDQIINFHNWINGFNTPINTKVSVLISKLFLLNFAVYERISL
jgi:hypothetical protein